MYNALDFYDDPTGTVIRRVFPKPDQIPDIVKEAELLEKQQLKRLPDDVFALILHEEDVPARRKYACVDSGNVALSVLYFMESGGALPEEAQKVAAANLVEACSWYDIKPPDALIAVAGERNLTKTASTLRPHVDITGKEAPVRPPEPERFALVKEGSRRYPIDTAVEVDAAIGYFQERATAFDPADRRLYCIKTAARADELGLPVPDSMRKYASMTFADPGEVRVSVLQRRKYFPEDASEHALLQEMAVKHAELQPEVFAAMLEEFDTSYGLHRAWDGGVPDPYWSTFGVQKQASWTYTAGGKTIGEAHLRKLAQEKVARVLGDDVAEGLADDPVTVFESLPNPHKDILTHMA